jgi:hypothetical protein
MEFNQVRKHLDLSVIEFTALGGVYPRTPEPDPDPIPEPTANHRLPSTKGGLLV